MANLPTKRRLDAGALALQVTKRGRAFDKPLEDVGVTQRHRCKGNLLTGVGATQRHQCKGTPCVATLADEQQQQLFQRHLLDTHPAVGEQMGGGQFNSTAGEQMDGEQVAHLATTKTVYHTDLIGGTSVTEDEKMSYEHVRRVLMHTAGPSGKPKGTVIWCINCGEAFAGEDELHVHTLVKGGKCRAALTGKERALVDARYCAGLRAWSDSLRRKADDYASVRAIWYDGFVPVD